MSIEQPHFQNEDKKTNNKEKIKNNDKILEKKKIIDAGLADTFKEVRFEKARPESDKSPYQIKEETTKQGYSYPVLETTETNQENIDRDKMDVILTKNLINPSSEKTIFNDLSLLNQQERKTQPKKKDKIIIVDNSNNLLE